MEMASLCFGKLARNFNIHPRTTHCIHWSYCHGPKSSSHLENLWLAAAAHTVRWGAPAAAIPNQRLKQSWQWGSPVRRQYAAPSPRVLCIQQHSDGGSGYVQMKQQRALCGHLSEVSI